MRLGYGVRVLVGRGHVLRDVDGTALADHGHLDLARILELGLDLARDLMREQNGLVVVDLPRENPLTRGMTKAVRLPRSL